MQYPPMRGSAPLSIGDSRKDGTRWQERDARQASPRFDTEHRDMNTNNDNTADQAIPLDPLTIAAMRRYLGRMKADTDPQVAFSAESFLALAELAVSRAPVVRRSIPPRRTDTDFALSNALVLLVEMAERALAAEADADRLAAALHAWVVGADAFEEDHALLALHHQAVEARK